MAHKRSAPLEWHLPPLSFTLGRLTKGLLCWSGTFLELAHVQARRFPRAQARRFPRVQASACLKKISTSCTNNMLRIILAKRVDVGHDVSNSLFFKATKQQIEKGWHSMWSRRIVKDGRRRTSATAKAPLELQNHPCATRKQEH